MTVPADGPATQAGAGDARVCLAGMHRVRRPQLPGPKRDPGRRTFGTEKILQARAQAYPAQRIAQEVIRDGSTPRHRRDRAGGASDVKRRRGASRPARPPATSVAQLVEFRSPKPAVGGSIPSARALRSGATRFVSVSRSVFGNSGALSRPEETFENGTIRVLPVFARHAMK